MTSLLSIADLKPTGNRIMFRFVEDLRQGMFFEKTESNIILGMNSDSSAKSPRWGQVIAVGDDMREEEIAPGVEILIDSLRWTDGMRINETEKVWFTTPDSVAAVRDSTQQ